MKNIVLLLMLPLCMLLLGDVNMVNNIDVNDIESINGISYLDISSVNGEKYVSGIDVSDYSYSSDFFTYAENTNPTDLVIVEDENKMYILDYSGYVYQYTITDLSDLSTVSYDSKSIDLSITQAFSIRFNSDGSKIYVIEYSTTSVKQFSLSTAWDISTATTDSKSFDFSSETTDVRGISFSPDYSKLLLASFSLNSILQYTVSDISDISTLAYDSKSLTLSGSGGPRRIGYSPNAINICFGVGQSIVQYVNEDNDDISLASDQDISLDVSADVSTLQGFHISSDTEDIIMLDNGNKKVMRYSK